MAWTFRPLSSFTHKDLLHFFLANDLHLFAGPCRADLIDGVYLASRPLEDVVLILGGPPRAKQRAARNYGEYSCRCDFIGSDLFCKVEPARILKSSTIT